MSNSLTSWTRIEPRCRTEDSSEALQARIVAPLWMLTQSLH